MIIWKYLSPNFEYKQFLNDEDLPWTGHIHFAYDLIRNLEPDVVAELGTYKGTSIFSMAQAAKDDRLKTNLYAIDCWEGDAHSGYYGDDIYNSVVDIARKVYIGVNLRLVRKFFDDALGDFELKSIDVLHIDGLHTYDAVKHDYETWMPKMKDDGIVIFHDIKVADYGVWQLWEEIKRKHPEYGYIEFEHNFGLGVIFKEKAKFKHIIDMSDLFVKYYAIKASEATLKFYNKDLTQHSANLASIVDHQKEEIELLKSESEEAAESTKKVTNSKTYKLIKALRRSIPI